VNFFLETLLYKESEAAMSRGKLFTAVLGLFLSLSFGSVCRAISVGDVAPNFTLHQFGTGTNASLYDLAGKVVLLDFFAYNCEPCKIASSEMEPNIQQYFAALGGNTSHVPVQILSLSNNLLGGTNYNLGTANYIATYGLDSHYVWDDLSQIAFNTYSQEAIPQFALVNGVDGAINTSTGKPLKQWEILDLKLSYSGGDYNGFRTIINQVAPIPEPATLTLLATGFLAVSFGTRGRWLKKRS
jgi:hypothetical protein